MDNEIKSIGEKLRERFLSLPKPVQEAINSSDIEKHLRELSETHKLHIDQWQKLENEVMLALLGLQEAEELEENIKKEVGVPDDVANVLTEDIAKMIFQPIREELERELEEASAIGNRQSVIGESVIGQSAGEQPQSGTPAPLKEEVATAIPIEHPVEQKLLASPSTPPPPLLEGKAARVSFSSVYSPGRRSSERKDVHEDPYREAP